ncbi:hypothetical protein Tco_0629303 [Tanacetum coccineum]|uniref:Uncharacterized protein n=1 Tax=Tanacetum coccineum TaxID=301880 RepID=A0ABQ4WST1_9ASTR
MERCFLSQKGSGGGRGVKEKNINKNKTNTIGIGLFTTLNGTLNEVTPVSAVKEDETPSVVDMTVENEKLRSVEDTTVLGSFSPLSTPVTTSDGNASGKSSYANVTGKPSGKKLNIRTLFTPGGSSTGLFSFQFSSMDGLDSMLEMGRSSYARVMIELRANVELKDYIVVAMPKIIGEGQYICNNTSVGEKKTLKKPSQTSRSVPVGLKIGFKPQKEYRPVPKKPIASSSGNKKKGVVPSIDVSNSNPFKVLNSVDNDVELATNGGGLLIWKFGELLTSRKATLVDEASNPLKKVEFLDDYDSEDEVASVDNDMARSMASERVGFGTQSLLEQ